MKLEQLDFETLHQKIYDLFQRQLAGDHSCDELLGKLLNEADWRGDEEVEGACNGAVSHTPCERSHQG